MQPKGKSVHGPPAQVKVISNFIDFAALRSEWNELVERTDDQIFHRHEFIATWLKHFAKGSLYVCTLRDSQGRLVAALSLLRSWSHLYGLPFRQLRSAANDHSGRFDLIADQPARASSAFLNFLDGQGGWDSLVLTDLPRSGRARILEKVASEEGLTTGRWSGAQSPCRHLPSTWPELESQLSSGFRSNLRRRRRRLDALGLVRAERCTDSDSLVASGIALEAQGWKGRAGTAIAQDAATLGFYTELAQVLAAQGQLALWALYLDDRLIAFQYGLEYQGSYALLKPAYDEEFSRYSPGQLLMAEVLRDGIARSLTQVDFLGEDMPWKQDWKPVASAQDWLFVFRASAYGRLLSALKFRLIPKVRQWRQSTT